MPRSAISRSLVAIFALGVAGCGSPALLQVETTIRPDGSCDRSIWQPKEQLLPAEALTPAWDARWAVVADVPIPPAFAEQASASSDRAYFHAQGVFATPAAIPSHLRKSIEGHPEFGAGELVHKYDRTDYGLFVEHRWSESLTNGVTREGFVRARDAFAEAALPILADGFSRIYGRDFDVDAAVDELNRRGPALLRDLLDVWYDAAAVGDAAKSSQVFNAGFVAAIERAGVGLHDAGGAVVSVEEGTRRIREHLAGRIAATFRKDGRPPRAEEIETILSSTTDPAISEAWSKYAAERKADYESRLAPLLVQMTGFYAYPPLLQPPAPRFAFGVRLPGEFVRADTNGEVDATGRVSWRFDAGRLYPGGFTMTARSLDLDRDAQRRLLGRVAIPDAASALSVRDLLADDPDLIAVLCQACKTGDAQLLTPTPGMDDARKMRLARLRERLRIAP
ncbi:hypothetical protein [Paludisphaera mucosa]|uniref:Lipoprotein n=1 Tax=Paludisphaera mucosa TaxID=3030827 RepID=A0ABT6FDR9_9BACT|nr:hypothetical protein [Paludisphaera mucosa]MDG3005614.1 hypothetical protein [Paludisphaera mucosa]